MEKKQITPYMYEPVRATQQAAANVAMDTSGDESDDDTHNVGLNERLRNTSWCLCTKCETQQTAAECLCCHEMHSLSSKLCDIACITEHVSFRIVCLNRDVLRTALVTRKQLKPESYREPFNNEYVFNCYNCS